MVTKRPSLSLSDQTMRNIAIATGEFYHVFNRGVDRRTIFERPEDFQRFHQYLYLFNDRNYRNPSGDPVFNDALLASQEVLPDDRDPYVDIAAYCLRGNHYHLLLRQRLDNGVAAFLHRLGMAYTKAFNRENDRSGALFEGTYQAVHVHSDAHILHLPRYIHLNALDLAFPEWRSGMVDDWSAAMNIIDQHPWSSHHYYSGRGQNLAVLSEETVRDITQDPGLYESFLREWTGRSLHTALLSLRDQDGH